MPDSKNMHHTKEHDPIGNRQPIQIIELRFRNAMTKIETVYKMNHFSLNYIQPIRKCY